MSFFAEIRRRKVFQVAAVYAVVAWLLIQIVATVEEPLNLPDWFDTVIIVLLAVGFPIAVILSWAFEVTPDGIVLDQGGTTAAANRGHGIEFVLAGLLLVATGWILYSELNTSASRETLPNSVAVLPFANLTTDTANAFFAPGIHDTVLHELSKIQDLNVIARTTMLRYEDTDLTIREIADELGVETVMEGTVQYASGRVLVTVQLIDPQTEAHRWSGNYDRELTDIFVIQGDIARRIASELEAELRPEELASIERPWSTSQEAIGLYFRAMHGIENIDVYQSEDRVTEFHRLLDEAIELDPSFARAYAAKADQYAESLEEGFEFMGEESRTEQARLAEQYAERALQIDPNLGPAHGALGVLYEYTGRTEQARATYLRALELSPNDRDLLINFAFFNFSLGESDQVVALGARLANIDPLWSSVAMGVGNQQAGNFEEAIAAYRSAIAIDSSWTQLNSLIALVELARGDADAGAEAAHVYEDWIRDAMPNAYDTILAAYLAHRFGRPAVAQAYLSEFRVMAEAEPVSRALWVIANLTVSNERAVLDELETLVENSVSDWSNPVWDIKYNQLMDPILERDAYARLRDRMGYR